MTDSPAQPREAPIAIRGLAREFDGGRAAILPLDLTIPSGSFVALLGPSGCGKSTLVRLLAGLDTPTAGSIERPQGLRLACVFQDPCLLPWRTVVDNTALPLELAGVASRACTDAALDALSQVGMADAADRYPSMLSGGMKMRVSLARALVLKPTFLLLDEPFAALDEITRQTLDDHLRDLWKSWRFTALFVTHAVDEAAYVADRAVVLSPGPGRVVLDLALDLPRERSAALRSEPRFAAETGKLREALAMWGGAR